MAERRGLKLNKVRRRDTGAIDYGRWYISEAARNLCLAENLTIDEVEVWLDSYVDDLTPLGSYARSLRDDPALNVAFEAKWEAENAALEAIKAGDYAAGLEALQRLLILSDTFPGVLAEAVDRTAREEESDDGPTS
jgi:hypothetical protein